MSSPGRRRGSRHLVVLALVQVTYAWFAGTFTWGALGLTDHDAFPLGLLAAAVVGAFMSVPLGFARAWALLLSMAAALVTAALLIAWACQEYGQLHGGEVVLFGWSFAALLYAAMLGFSYASERASRARPAEEKSPLA